MIEGLLHIIGLCPDNQSHLDLINLLYSNVPFFDSINYVIGNYRLVISRILQYIIK